MNKDNESQPLSESSVSLKLAMIQERCRELAQQDEFGGLSLEEPVQSLKDNTNPYDLG